MLHVFLIFTLIFLISSLTYFILYQSQYMRLKEIKEPVKEIKTLWMVIMFWGWFSGPIIVLSIVEIILYCLILTNIVGAVNPYAWADAFMAIGVINYVSCICFLFILTIGANSVWIKVKDDTIFFLDEGIPLNVVKGIAVKRVFKKIVFNLNGDDERKIFITKRVFKFLRNL